MNRSYEQEWNGLTRGDIIKIAGETGDYKFMHAAYKDGELDCIMIVGGTKGHSQWRCVAPDRIKKLSKKAQSTRRGGNQ